MISIWNNKPFIWSVSGTLQTCDISSFWYPKPAIWPELGTLKWDILNPDRLINLENKHFLIWRLGKREDQALILIFTIQKFPAQDLEPETRSWFIAQISYNYSNSNSVKDFISQRFLWKFNQYLNSDNNPPDTYRCIFFSMDRLPCLWIYSPIYEYIPLSMNIFPSQWIYSSV